MSIQDVNAQLAESFGLDRPRGALVGMVEDDSPGDKAGIKAGDVILKVDGTGDRYVFAGAWPDRQQEARQRGRARSVARRRRPSELTARPEEIEEKARSVAARGRREPMRRAGSASQCVRCDAEEKRQAETDGDLVVEDVDGPAAGGRRAAAATSSSASTASR